MPLIAIFQVEIPLVELWTPDENFVIFRQNGRVMALTPLKLSCISLQNFGFYTKGEHHIIVNQFIFGGAKDP